jgi:RHS repeat-associated protein
VLTTTNDGTPGVPTVALTSTYDTNSRRSSLAAEIDATDDFLNSYTYDNLNRLTRVDQTANGGNTVANKRVDFTYTAIGQFDTITRKYKPSSTWLEAITSTYTYDTLNRLTAIDHKHSTTDIANYDFTYDFMNRMLQFSGPDGTTDFTYDKLSQVTAADHSYQTDESYTYDNTGNRDDANYDVASNNRMSTDGIYNYTYDSEGNRATRTRISDDYVTTYEWDHRNRLVSVIEEDDMSTVLSTVEYAYDVFDRRLSKTIDADGPGGSDPTEVHYVYDGPDIVLQFDEEEDLSHRYLQGPAIDQILADEDAANYVLWALTDHQGTVRDLAENDGDVANHIKYNTFGTATNESDPGVDHFYGYTGRERDEETGLQFNRGRYYDPLTGKFLSHDPINFSAGDPNLARYVANNAPNRIDPFGRDAAAVGGEGAGQAGGLLSNPEYMAWMRATTDFVASMGRGQAPGGGHGDWLDWAAGAMLNYETERALNMLIPGREMNQMIQNQAEMAGTLYHNTEDYDAASRMYIIAGTMAGDFVGVRGIDDMFHTHDAVDAHVQTLTERATDGVGGMVTLVMTAVGLQQIIMRPPACPGNTCFVAGTEVLVPASTSVRHVADASETSMTGAWQAPLGWALTIGFVGLALAPLGEEYRRRRRRQDALDCDGTRPDDSSDAPVDSHAPATCDDYFEDLGRIELVATRPGDERPAVRSIPRLPARAPGQEVGKQPRSPKSEPIVRWRSWKNLLALAVCLSIAAIGGLLALRGSLHSTPAGAASPVGAEAKHDYRPIETIRVGQRVITDLPEDILDIDGQPFDRSLADGETRVDPATWRLIRMRAETRWEDGTLDDINIETLQPLEWIEAHKVRAGADAPIPLDLVEMGLPETLFGTVEAVESCPRIAEAPGRIVLTTVNHLNPHVVELTVRNGVGKTERIRPTANHRFFSLDRKSWQMARDLAVGERLNGLGTDLTVLSVVRVPGVHIVYNMTVEEEHVYYVSSLLTHNNGCRNPVSEAARSGQRNIDIAADHRVRIDVSTPDEGGFHMHVYDADGVEVARVNGRGGFSDSHGGAPLSRPCDLPRAVRNDINRIWPRWPGG